MSKATLAISMVVLMLVFAAPAPAVPIFNTLSPDNRYSFNGYIIGSIGNDSQGIGQHIFVTGTDWRVDSVQVVVKNRAADPISIAVSITADDSGLPGSVLESHTIGVIPGVWLIDIPFPDGTVLKMMSTYWLTLTSSDYGGTWLWNSPPQVGTVACSKDGGGTWFNPTNPVAYFSAAKIEATPTPEPTTLSLLALGGLALLRRKKGFAG